MSETSGSSFQDVQIAILDTAMNIVDDSLEKFDPSLTPDERIKYKTDKVKEVYSSLYTTVFPK